MNSRARLALLLVCALGVAARNANAQFQVQRSVVGNGGDAAVNGTYRLSGTAGQPVVGNAGNATQIQKAGFWAPFGLTVTGIERLSGTLPLEFRLEQNHPNPFNPATRIGFEVKEPCRVILKVYNMLGREMKTVVDEPYLPGQYEIRFRASGLASGIYFYRIQMGDFSAVRKMAVVE